MYNSNFTRRVSSTVMDSILSYRLELVSLLADEVSEILMSTYHYNK